MKLVDGVYCYPWRGYGANANTYALKYLQDGRACCALIDPGFHMVPPPGFFGAWREGMELRPGTEALISLLREDGIAPEQVKLILNTHGHQDHVDAGIWWRTNYDTRIAIHEADMRFCANAPTWKQHVLSEGRMPLIDMPLEEGDLLLGDQESGTTLRIVHTPGHSPGSISIYHSGAKVLFTGDVVFFHTVGASHFHHGNPADLRRSIERLAELNVEHLLPGHSFHDVEFISGREQVEDNFRYVMQNRL